MEILTLNDYNLIACNCCALPSCEAPLLSCQSITATVANTGFQNLDDTEWIIYKKYTLIRDMAIGYSSSFVTDTGSANETTFNEYDKNFEGVIVGNCLSFVANLSTYCDTSGNRTTTYYTDDVAETRYTTERTLLSANPCQWVDVTTFSDLNEDPPVDDVVTEEHNTSITTMYGQLFDGGNTFTVTHLYESPATFTQWKDSTRSELIGTMNFETLSCISNSCNSSFTTSPLSAAPGNNVSMTLTKSRYKYGVPTEFTALSSNRSYYELQWDEVFFPTLSSDGPPTVVASRSWIWNGDKDNPWSDFYESSIPAVPGIIRNVNMMVKCWKSSRIGNKPTAFGEVYES
jgi:hypothetical protein